MENFKTYWDLHLKSGKIITNIEKPEYNTINAENSKDNSVRLLLYKHNGIEKQIFRSRVRKISAILE